MHLSTFDPERAFVRSQLAFYTIAIKKVAKMLVIRVAKTRFPVTVQPSQYSKFTIALFLTLNNLRLGKFIPL